MIEIFLVVALAFILGVIFGRLWSGNRIQSSLQVEFAGANLFQAANGMAGIGLIVRLWNIGDPIYVVKRKLFVHLPSGTVEAFWSPIPDRLTLGGAHPVILTADMCLVPQMDATSVAGKPLTGVLLFYAETESSETKRPDTVFELILTDSNGTDWSFRQCVGDWAK